MAVSEWVGPDAPVAIVGVDFTGIYVGPTDTPEVIDPDLRVDVTEPDWNAASVRHPPHYGELTPQARAAFLVWHRTGRRAPQAPPVWALLHLYGLERRILIEGDDAPELREEATELGVTYGTDPEVARVASALSGDHPHTAPPPLVGDSFPDDLKVELGRRALVSAPVDVAWALAWAWFHPDIPRREAATRTTDEFARLWTLRFTERFQEGLVVRPKRRRLTLDYTPANPSLPASLDLIVPDASDVFSTTEPATVLREITEQVEAELAAFAQWRTRFPDEPAGSIRAAAALPQALLLGSDAEQAARPLVDVAVSALGDVSAATLDSDRLVGAWSDATGQDTVERRDAVEIAQVLERFGVGVEPDVRFGGRSLHRQSPAVVFRQTGTPTTSPSDSYASALVALELCAAVAAADGTVDDAEQAVLVTRVEQAEGLTEAERGRLDAHRLLVTSSALRLEDVAARVVRLPLVERHALASYLLDLARADGTVTDDEVQVLRAVHDLLDLDPDEVERRLRPRAVPLLSVEDLVEPAAPEVPDILVEQPTARLVQVDEDALRARQQDNHAVQAMLASIFDDDEDDEDVPDEAPAAVGGIATLDAAHSALLRDLAQCGHTIRRDLEFAAAKHGVLPDGALDVLNEAALDLVEDPVIEIHDDGSVTVDHDVYEEMRA